MKMKPYNIILTICVLLLAVSCGTLGKYKPIDKVDENLYGNIADGTTRSIGEIPWQDFFTDPVLQGHIRTALDNNIDLKASYEHIVQADASLTAAKLSFVPTLNLKGSATYASKLSVTTYSAISTWQLDIFRKVNSLKSAKAAKEQMEDYRQAVVSSLISSVASTYYSLLMLDSQLAVTSDLEKNWISSVETVIALRDAGMADQVAVSQYQATLANVTATRIELEKQVKITENTFNSLLSLVPGTPVERTHLSRQSIPATISAGVPATILTARPDVRAAQRNVEMAYYAKGNALLDYFPTVSLSATLSKGLLYSLGASILEPVLNSGANRAKYKGAESAQREACLEFEKTVLAAGTEICNAMATYQSCDDKAWYYKSQAENLDKARQDTDYLMRNSSDKTYLDVLYAYNSYFDAILNYISNQAQKMQAAASLYSALGGGTEK